MMAAAQQLSPFDRRRLDEHLAACTRCSEFYRDMMTLAGAVATLPTEASEPLPAARHLELVPAIPKVANAPKALQGGHDRRFVAAALIACFACGWGSAHLFALRSLPKPAERTVQVGTVPRVIAKADGASSEPAPSQVQPQPLITPSRVLDEMGKGERAEVSRLRAAMEQSQNELASLREQDRQATHASDELAAEVTRLRQESSTQTALLTQVQAQLDQARTSHVQDLKLIAMREDQLRQMTASAGSERTELADDHRQGEAFRLMGQRNLHVVDVFDTDRTGKRSSTFGRVFYSDGGPMMFVAFDLPGHGDAEKTVFHAWGQTEGSTRKPLQLGTFAKDEGASHRWVLRVSDTDLLRQVDAVFVTADRARDVRNPDGPPLLYAYLRQVPNHP